MAAFFALMAFIFAALFGLFVALYVQKKGEFKALQLENLNINQRARASLARFQGIIDLEKYKSELEIKINQLRSILPNYQSLAEMEQHKTQLTNRIAELNQANSLMQSQLSANQARLADIKAQTEAVEEALEIQSFGFYRPKYDFKDSKHYMFQLTKIRDAQKAMVKSKSATHCPREWTVDGSEAKGRKMINEQSKLMLRAFNGECDYAISQVKYNNVNIQETRIDRSFEAVNKLGESKQLWISHEYKNLKLQELYLVHEHRQKVQEELEEQRRIKEQIREEEKVLKEIEKAKREAEQEEALKSKALEKARQELALANENQMGELQATVQRLELELQEAKERKERAISRAQQTKSGNVYIISNIGSFGDGIFKIGMTRRDNPEDRVKELSDASVPFPFDIHAMIPTEDAPSLENLLHKHFDSRRVNMINMRREFFRVTLEEIRDVVEKNHKEITIIAVPEAEEYRRTLSMQNGG